MPSQYEPRTAPVFDNKDMQQLVSFMMREFDNISDVFTGVQNVMLQEQQAPPQKFFKGMVVLADGVHWNPGSGKGYYGYDGTTWRYLG